MERIVRTVGLWSVLLTTASGPAFAEWRHIGTAAMDLRLSGLATGPVAGIGWSADGTRIFTRSLIGRWLSTEDAENWLAVMDMALNDTGVAQPMKEQITAAFRRGALMLVNTAG